MADRSLAIRLAVIDGGRVKAELRDVGDAGSRSLMRIEDAARPASRALQALDGVAGEVRGGLEDMAGRAGPLGAGLMRLGPAGLAAAAAIGAVTLGLKGSLEEAAKADQSCRRLEAVLNATGHASGLTADEIASFADGIERSTLATAEGVEDAASVLATFRSVSGDTFTRALRLAQDMSAVFGQDLSGAATQLGKALEDPIDGLTALRRVGISFSDTQKGLIRSLAETGQTAEAQRMILDALEQQVGGAGAAEAGGLTGATNRLQDAWGNLLEAIGRTPVVTSLAQGALDLLSGAIEGITSSIEDDPIGQRIEAAKIQLARARDELARLKAGGPGTPMLGQRFAIEEQHQRIATLEQELATLTKIGEAADEAARQERARAEAGQQAAEAERRADALTAQRSQLSKALDQLETDPAERIAQVNRELAETKKRLEALRAPDASNVGDVDAAMRQAEEIAHRKIAAINQPMEEAARRAREAAERPEQAAAERAYQANERVVDDLARQLALFGDERRQFVDQALSRLSESASDEQWVQVEQLANALYDEKLAREQLAETMRQEQQLRQEGVRLTEQMRTPTEQLAATLEELDRLMRAGAIDAGTHGRAVAEAYREAEQPADRMLSSSRELRDGVTRALRDYADQATDAASAAEQVTTQAFQAMEDALVQFVATGKLDFASLVDTMLADLTRLSIRMAMLGPLAKALGGSGGIGDWISGLFGGGASTPSPLPQAGGGAYAELPYAHGGAFWRGERLTAYALGGIVDRPTLFPMARGWGLMGEAGPEGVLPLRRTPSGDLGVAATGGGPQVTVNVINNAGAKVSAQERKDERGGLTIDVMIDAVEQAMAQRATRPGTTLNRALAQAANPVRAR